MLRKILLICHSRESGNLFFKLIRHINIAIWVHTPDFRENMFRGINNITFFDYFNPTRGFNSPWLATLFNNDNLN